MVLPINGMSPYLMSGIYNAPQYANSQYLKPQVAGRCDMWDDGKIDSSVATKEFFGGMLDSVKGLFTGKGLLTAAVIGGLCLIPGVGQAIAIGGLALGAFGLGKSIFKGACAKTDADKMAAWREGGASFLATVLSFIGFKGFKGVGKGGQAASEMEVAISDARAAVSKHSKLAPAEAEILSDSIKPAWRSKFFPGKVENAQNALAKANKKLEDITDTSSPQYKLAEAEKTLAEKRVKLAEARENASLYNTYMPYKGNRRSALSQQGKVATYTTAAEGVQRGFGLTDDENPILRDPRYYYGQQGYGGYPTDPYGFNNSFSMADIQRLGTMSSMI